MVARILLCESVHIMAHTDLVNLLLWWWYWADAADCSDMYPCDLSSLRAEETEKENETDRGENFLFFFFFNKVTSVLFHVSFKNS